MKRYRKSSVMLTILKIILILFLTATPFVTPPTSIAQTPDTPPIDYRFYERDLVTVKFNDGQNIRLREGRPTDLDGKTLTSPRARAAFNAVAEGEWSRTHTIPEGDLDAMAQRATKALGKPVADLNLSFRLQLPPNGVNAEQAIALFEALPEVDSVQPVPKPMPPPIPPDYVDPNDDNFDVSLNRHVYQRYLDAATDGLDARYAWNGDGGTAEGINICDVEYGWNASHADLPAVTLLGDFPASDIPDSWFEHGTAVIGQLAALDNGWGVTGIAPDADIYFAATKTDGGGYNVAAAITRCANALAAGDVILIEQQIAGPNYDGDGDDGLVPVEWYESIYDAIVAAVGNGIIVVEAGGNGGENLDDVDYAPVSGVGSHHPFKVANDSGAIIVGAGNSPYIGLPRSRASFSNYGDTVDLQGWGDNILTTGYGTYYSSEGKNLWYRHTFGGTSGASPMVTAAAAIAQANYKLSTGNYVPPGQVKSLLINTGTPQEGVPQIGPLPDLKAAIESIWNVTAPEPPTLSPGTGTYAMPMQVTIDYAPSSGQNASNTAIRYTLNGTEPTEDSFIFVPEFDDGIYLNYGVTVKAKAFQFDAGSGRRFASSTTAATYTSSTPTVATPQITPGGGTYNQPHQVTLSTTTPGATIRYRTDGRNISFFYPGTVYDGPITLDPGTYEITVRAYKDGYYKSAQAESGSIVVNALTLPSPTIYPSSGQFAGQVTVYMGSTVLGAEIRYTTNGAAPSASSPLFVNPIAITQTTTVKARITLDGYTESAVTEATFDITQQATTPAISPSGGTHSDSVSVSLSTTTSGATIRYTTNGAEPTSYSTMYSGSPFNLGPGEHTVKAKAFLADANPSATATENFTVYDTTVTVVEPEITPASGNHTGNLTVTLTTDTEGATIYYNIDDINDPAVLYTGPIVLSPSGFAQIVKARAFKDATYSSINQKSFNIFTPVGTVLTPTISPNGGTFTNSVQVTFSADKSPPNAGTPQFWRTTDGSDPVSIPNASAPSNPFSLSTPAVLKVMASQLGYTNSVVASADFNFICDTPTISPTSGTFTDSVTVTMDTGTNSAGIYFTSNGEEPIKAETVTTTKYSDPVALGVGTYVIQAKCFRSPFEDSETALSVIVVNPTPVTPTLLTHPVSQTVNAGTAVSFTSEASGTTPLNYQWQRDSIDLAGEIEPVLEIPAASVNHAGSYHIVVRNDAGVVTSTPALLTVNPISADLSIAKSVHTDTADSGNVLTYTLVVANAGPEGPVTAAITDSFSSADALSDVVSPDCTWTPGSTDVSCQATVDVGTPVTITLVVTTSSTFSGTLSNSASIAPPEGVLDPNAANDTTGSVQVTLIERDTTPPTVDAVTPTDGTSSVPRNTALSVDFSEAMQTDSVSVIITPTTMLTPSWSAGDSYLSLAHPDFAAETRYTVTVSAGHDLADNPLGNAPYTWYFTTSTEIAAEADVAMNKSRVGTGDVLAGENITYTFTLTNAGPTTPVTATLVDTFSTADALSAITGAGCAWTAGTTAVTCTVASIAVDSPVAVTLVVSASSTFSGTLRNTATISLAGDVVDVNPGNDNAELSVDVRTVVVDKDYVVYLPMVLRE